MLRKYFSIALLIFVTSACLAQSTASAEPPVQISNGPVVENITETSATIAWSTNVSAGSSVRYGTERDSLTSLKQAPWGGYTHRLNLENLQPGATYYFQAESGHAQGTGTSTQSSIMQFRTKGTPAKAQEAVDSALAMIDGPQIERTTASSVTIRWSTNAPSSTVLKYGTERDKLKLQEMQPWGDVNHRVELRHLKPDTLYYYQAVSGEGDGFKGQAASAVQSFRTQRLRD
jgi:phosphodiesterase/alkaline phosphatase D-like protein